MLGRAPDSRGLRYLAASVFALGLAVSVAALVATWHRPITDAHSFRQTQTAITAYWIGHGGPLLAYHTPVLGAPWSVPFELPVFQAVVAAVHQVLPVSWDATGRIVSWLFFAATLWQLYSLVRALDGARELGLLVCGLVAMSPLYVFWSRAFMIESTALCFSVAFVHASVRHVRAPTVVTGIALVVLAAVAGLVKLTTFLPFGIAGALVVMWDLRDPAHRKDRRRWLVHYLPVAVAGVIAVAAVLAWTSYADSIKLDHPFGRSLTSDKLSPWLYGPIAQRWSPGLWRDVIFGRTLSETLGGVVPLVVAIGAAIAFGRAAIAWLGLLIGLYLVPFLVFTNLHAVHNYYQYANALFVVAAIGVVAWHARDRWQRWLAVGLVAVTAIMQIVHLARVEWPMMRADLRKTDTMQLRRALRDLPADGVILVFGYDWSAEVAYYAQRRAITVPAWASREQLESLRDQPMLHTDGHPIVAVVDCPNPLHGSPDLGAIFDAILADQTRGRREMSVAACKVWR